MSVRVSQGWGFFGLFVSTVLFFVAGMVSLANLERITKNNAGEAVVFILALSLILIFAGWIAWGTWVAHTKN